MKQSGAIRTIRIGCPVLLSVAVASSTLFAQHSSATHDLEFEPAAGPAWTHAARGQYTVMVAGTGFTVVPEGTKGAGVRFELCGAAAATPVEEDRAPGVSHHLRGSDPSRWRTFVPHYRRLRYPAAWEGVDVVLHGRGQRLQYDFELAPGADPARVAVRVHGATLAVRERDLHVRTPTGTLVQARPIAFQDGPNGRDRVEADYRLLGRDRVAFRLGPYDRSRPLVIDPVIGLTSWLGGWSSDQPHDVAVDAQGFAYVVGTTRSVDFPVASPLQASLQGGEDAFVTKIDPTGTAIVWSTFLGGTRSASTSAATESGVAVAVDGNGEAVVVGYTDAVDFPVTPNAAQPTVGGQRDLFVARLDGSGSALLFSTYLGGSATEGLDRWSDPGSCDVAVDSAGNAVVCGVTNSPDLPLSNAFQSSLAGGYDTLVAAYSPAGALWTATYLGGSGDELRSRIATSPSDDVLVCGYTESADMQWTPGAWSGGASTRGFVARLAPLGRRVIACSSFPAAPEDIAAHPGGDVILCGTTGDRAFIRTRGSLSVRWSSPATTPRNDEAFVSRLAGDLSRLRWSTLLGTPQPPERARSIVAVGDEVRLLYRGSIPGEINWHDQHLVTLSDDGRAIISVASFWSDNVALAASPNGSTWIVGSVASPNSSQRSTPGCFQPNPVWGVEGVVHRVDEAPHAQIRIAPLDGWLHPGDSITATVTLDGKAPPGGVALTLVGSPSGVFQHPATVTIPAGSSVRSFQVTAAQTALPTACSLVASDGLLTATLRFEIRHHPTYRVVALQPLAVTSTAVEAIDNDGSAVGTARMPAEQAFVFSDQAGFVTLPARTASAITESGSIFGVVGPDTVYRLDPPSPLRTLFGSTPFVCGATGDGAVVGATHAFATRLHAFYWSAATGLVDIGTNGGHGSWAYAINEFGVVVGAHARYPASIGPGAFRWTLATGLIGLGALPGDDESAARDINDHGEICGWSTDTTTSSVRAVRFEGGGVRGLYGGVASGINDHGQVVGGHGGIGSGPPMLWTETTGPVVLDELVDPIDSMGWQLHGAVDINDHGQVVGIGSYGQDRSAVSYRLDPLSTVAYGTGCPTRSGEVPILTGEGFPWRGTAFALVATDATPQAPSVLLLGVASAATPLVGRCTLLVDRPLAATVSVDGTGRVRHTFQVPTTARGVVFAQLLQVDTLAPSGLLSMSRGLRIRLD